MDLIPVKVVADDDGHWYIIPDTLYDSFCNDLEDENIVDSGEFDDKYSKYMTGGDLNLVQLYAEL